MGGADDLTKMAVTSLITGLKGVSLSSEMEKDVYRAVRFHNVENEMVQFV